MQLINDYETLKIQTYCDWYGPNYTVSADISQHGAVTTVDPPTALLLVGGGCTGNRVAYNQTAADSLLANGFSEYTMMMMQQAMPANTNVTTIPKKALTFVESETTTSPSIPYLVPIILGVVGVAVIAGSFIAYKKLKH
jgi:hypothetical protein